KDKEKFVNSIINNIPYFDDIGYAGYKSKNALKEFLIWSIYGFKQNERWESVDIEKIKKIIEETIIKCKSVINQKIKIFVFPTIDNFIIEKMDGVAGFSPWRNTMIINLNPTKKMDSVLKDTVGHELAHALALNYNERITIQDDLIFEGIAEHFKENFVNKKKSKWVKSIPKKIALKILGEIKSKLNMRDKQLYKDLFFGSAKYPLWVGYAIGYYIIDNYLKNHKIEWNKFIKISPKEIINENNKLKYMAL
ncbi:MAG: DUF2268 domain-containing protein, partial [Nanoarchaeota archaeon]|nr:DUF2268 domain-containing protein [Nanoarchaeota archaeon]